MRTTPGSLTHPPHTRLGLGTGEAGIACVLPCSSLSTQVLHRRRPGRTEWAWAVAAFKYLLGPPYPHPTFPPRPWLPRATANWGGHEEEEVPAGTRSPLNILKGFCDAGFEAQVKVGNAHTLATLGENGGI